jgi:hypothetical protein
MPSLPPDLLSPHTLQNQKRLSEEKMMLALAIADFLLLVINVGLIDWFLFVDRSSCPRCGMQPAIYSWIPSTFLELALFVLGIGFGFFILK